MEAEVVLEAEKLGKVFRTYRRKPGFRGMLANFFRREYLEIRALVDIDLKIRRGEFVGLIGSNGAGKTTLVKLLTGIVAGSSGRSTVLGVPSFHLTDGQKRKLALVMGQRSQLWWDLPALDSFHLLAEIYEVPPARMLARAWSFAERLEVADRLDVQLRHLSLGQRMKMEIIGAFVHEPEIVFLDEPTIGLDLVSRETIRQFLIETNRREGATVVLTSHDMEDIESTCRRLMILDAGRMLFDGDLVELQQRIVGERAIELHLEPGSRAWTPDLGAELAPFGARLVRHGPLSIVFSVPASSAQRFVQHLFDLFQVRDLSVERVPLEDLVRDVFRARSLDVRGAAPVASVSSGAAPSP
ncbi:MAG: ATP-binding cassette domain-containing protein [Planctomycetes bacterium]|nr:ATP-binding cassette domain-containing protein [Planctomycetota bacterium]